MSAEKPEGPEGATNNPETSEVVEEIVSEDLKTQQEDPSEVANPGDDTVPVNDSKGEEDIKVEADANEESPDITKEDDDGEVMGEISPQQTPKIQEKEKMTTSPRTKTSVESSQGLPYMRSSVILSLEEAKEKVTVISQKITNLKNQILEHEQKGLLTDEDLKHMKLIQAELMDNLSLCNLTSKYICGLIGIEPVSSSHLDMSLPPIPRKGVMPKNDKTTSGTVQKIVGRKEKATLGPPVPGIREVDDIYLERYSEEKLPKVIVCDVGSIDKVPRIFVCEPIKKNDLQPFHQSKNFETGQSKDFGKTQAVSHLSKPHNLERNSIREPLAPDSYNQPLYNNQQSKASSKPQYPTGSRKIHPEPNGDIHYFQNLVHKMETTIESLRKENIELQRKAQYNSQHPQPKICRRLLSQKGQESTNERISSKEEILGLLNMKCDNATQNQYLSCGKKPICKLMLPVKETQTISESEKDNKFKLLEEQYKQLNRDFKKKVADMAVMKSELGKSKKEVDSVKEILIETENSSQDYLKYIQKLEFDKNKLLQFKEQYNSMEQETKLANEMHLASESKQEEFKTLLEEVSNQLEDYRKKYLQSLTVMEEQKRDIQRQYQEYEERAASEMKNKTLEIQKLSEELQSNKILLKEANENFKVSQQMHTIASDNINEMAEENRKIKREIRNLQDVLSKSKSNKSEDKIATLSEQLRHAEENNESLKLENERLMTLLGQIEKTANENELLLEEKTHEIKILHNQIGILREESARQITRSKKTFDAMKTSMQVQISNLETVLIQTRGDVYAARRREQEAQPGPDYGCTCTEICM